MQTDTSRKNVSNPLWYLFAKTWHYSNGNRRSIAVYWTMFIMANAITLIAYPLVMKNVIDTIQQEGITSKNISFLLWLLVATFAVQLIFWALHGPARLLENANGFLARANYRKYLLKGIMTLPMEWHAEHHSGDTIDKVEKGTQGLYEFSKSSFEVIYAVGQLIIGFGMLIYFSPSAAYIVFAVTLVAVWIIMRFDKLIVLQYQVLNQNENSISESVFDAISNIATVIILRVERLVFEAIVHKIDKPFELFKSNSRLNEAKWFLMSMCCNAMVTMVLGAYFIMNMGVTEGILLGNVYILIQCLDRISETLARFAGMYGEVLQRKARVLNAEVLAGDFKAENFTNHVLPKDWQHLTVCDLNFSYHATEGADLHLVDVSFTLKRGERIALVGESGSGKTTLLKIIRDLYHPKSLKLLVDGRQISGFDGISRAIALVLQDFEIFATTIRDNITVGAQYDPAFVQQFTDIACFTDVIGTLPHGLNSSIKEKGVNLSGGQKQRLALARGLLACHDKEIVLLDEQTSNLDAANEMKIYQNILEGFEDKTIISSIHHLRLLPLFHRIFFMRGGKIVASGSLSDLLATCPEFEELWQKYHSRNPEPVTS